MNGLILSRFVRPRYIRDKRASLLWDEKKIFKICLLKVKRCFDAQHYDTQHNDIQHNDIQYNDIQHNDTQNNI